MGNENSRPAGEANLDKEEIQVRINEPVVTAAHGKIHRLHNAKAAPIEPASLQGSGFFYHPDLRALKSKGVIQRVGAKKLPPKLGHAPKGGEGGEGEARADGLQEHKSNIPQGTPVELFYARPKGSGRVFYIKSDNRSSRVNTSVRSAYPYYPPKPVGEEEEAAENGDGSLCIRPPVFGEPSFTHRELYSESGAMARQSRLEERKQDYASPAEARVNEDRDKEKEEEEVQARQQQEQQREQREQREQQEKQQREQEEKARKEQEEQAQKDQDAKRQQARKEQEERAAVKIQSSWRGLQGRREGERRREERRQAFDRNRQRRATGTWEDVDEFGVIALPKPAPGHESAADKDEADKKEPVEEEPVEDTKAPSTPLPEILTQAIPGTDGDGNEALVSYSKSLLKSMPSEAPAETEHSTTWLSRIKELRVVWKKTIRQWEKDFAAENDRKPEKADKMSIKAWYLFDKKLKEKEGIAQAWVDSSTSADAQAPSGPPPSGPAPSAPPPSAPAPSAPPPSGPPPSGPPPSGPPPSGPPPSGPPPSGPPPSGPPPSGPPPSGPPPSGPPPSGPPPSGPPPSGPPPSGPPPSGPPPSGPPPSGPPPSAPPPSAPPPSAPEPEAKVEPTDGDTVDKPSTLVDAIPPGGQPDDLHAFTKLLLSQSKDGANTAMKDEWVARIKELRLVWKKTIRQWEKDFAAENDRKPEQADKMTIKAWYVNDKKLKKQLEALTA